MFLSLLITDNQPSQQTVHLPSTFLVVPVSCSALGVYSQFWNCLCISLTHHKRKQTYFIWIFLRNSALSLASTCTDWKADVFKAVSRAESSWAVPWFMQVGQTCQFDCHDSREDRTGRILTAEILDSLHHIPNTHSKMTDCSM